LDSLFWEISVKRTKCLLPVADTSRVEHVLSKEIRWRKENKAKAVEDY